MTYGMQDVVKQRQLIELGEAPDAQKQIERRKLDAILGLCETTACRRQILLGYGFTGCLCAVAEYKKRLAVPDPLNLA